MLAESGVDDAHVEQNLGRIGYCVELLQCLIELVIVVAPQGGDPGLYFLLKLSVGPAHHGSTRESKCLVRTCFRDMAAELGVARSQRLS